MDDVYAQLHRSLAPTASSGYEAYAAQNQEEEPSILSQVAHGLSWGIVGKQAPGTMGMVIDIAGNLATGIGAEIATGGLATPILGAVGVEGTAAKLVTRLGVNAALAGLTTGGQSVAGEDNVSFMKNLGIFLGLDAVTHVGPLYSILKGAGGRQTAKTLGDTAITDIGAKMSKQVEDLFGFKIPAEELSPKLTENIKKVNDLHDQLLELDKMHLGELETTLDDRIYGQKRTEKYGEARLSMENSLQNFWDKMGRRLTEDEYKLFEQMIPNLGNVVYSEDEIIGQLTQKHQPFKTGNIYFPGKTPANIDKFMENVEKLNYDMTRVNMRYMLGLSPGANYTQVTKALEKFDTARAALAEKQLRSPERLKLREGLINTMLDIMKNRKDLPTGFHELPDYLRFVQSVNYIANMDDDLLNMAAKSKSVIEDAVKTEKNRLVSMARSYNSALRYYNSADTERIGKVEGWIRDGVVFSLKEMEPHRTTLQNIIRNRLIAHMPPDLQNIVLQSVDTNKDINAWVKQFLIDPQQGKQLIPALNDPILERAYYMWRATFNDPESLDWYRGFIHESQGNIDKSMAIQSVNLSPEKDFTGKDIDKPTGGLAGFGSGGGSAGPVPPPGTQIPGAEYLNQMKLAVPGEIQPGAVQAAGKTTQQLEPSSLTRQLLPLNQIAERFTNKVKGTSLEMLGTGLKWAVMLTNEREVGFRRMVETTFKAFGSKINEALAQLPKETRDTFYSELQGISKMAAEMSGIDKAPRQAVSAAVERRVAAMPEAMQEAYRKYREMDDWVYNLVNSGIARYNKLVEMGWVKGEVKPYMEYGFGHSPFIYDGDYILRNDRGYYFIAKSEQEAITHLEAVVKDSNQRGNFHIEPRWITNSDEASGVRDIYKQVTDLFTHDLNDIREALAGKRLTEENFKNYMFGGMEPRNLAVSGSKLDPVSALYLRSLQAAKFYHYYDVTRLMDEYHGAFLDQGLKNFATAIRVYGSDILGHSRDSEIVMDNFIKNLVGSLYMGPRSEALMNSLGMSDISRPTRSITNGLRFFSRTARIGFNFTTAMINELILLHNVVPEAGFRNTTQAMLKIGNVLRSGNTKYKEVFDKLGLDLLAPSREFSGQMTFPEFIVGKGRRIMDWLDSKSMWMFNTSEKMSKGISAMAFRDEGERLAAAGKFGGANGRLLKEIAERMGQSVNNKAVLDEYAFMRTAKATFLFNTSALPEFWRNPMAKPFLQFKTYFLDQMTYILGKLGAPFGPQRDLAGAFKTLGIMTMLGGVQALPGMEELDAIARHLFGRSPKQWAEENLGDVAAMGMFASQGVDISQRVNFGSFVRAFDPANSFGSFTVSTGKAIAAMLSGDENKALAYVTPTFLRNLKAAHELYSTGQITSEFERGAVIRPDTEPFNKAQLVARGLGMPTTYETKYKVLKDASIALHKNNKALRNQAMTMAYNEYSADNVDEAMKYLSDAGIQTKQFQEFVKRQSLDPYRRILQLMTKEERLDMPEDYL